MRKLNHKTSVVVAAVLLATTGVSSQAFASTHSAVSTPVTPAATSSTMPSTTSTPAAGSSMAAPAGMSSSTSMPASTGMEKCYGVAKTGMNDCDANDSSCTTVSTMDGDVNYYVNLPVGVCVKLVNGSLVAGQGATTPAAGTGTTSSSTTSTSSEATGTTPASTGMTSSQASSTEDETQVDAVTTPAGKTAANVKTTTDTAYPDAQMVQTTERTVVVRNNGMNAGRHYHYHYHFHHNNMPVHRNGSHYHYHYHYSHRRG